MKRRSLLKTIAATSVTMAVRVANAQSSIMRLVVPYAAGGQTDVIARMLATSMQASLSRTVIVENRPGAAALIGTRYVAAYPPNGDTLLLHNVGLVTLPLVQKEAAYDPVRDFSPVAMTGIGPYFLMVHDSVPARTVPEFLAYAREQKDGLDCANSGINSGGHIAALLLEKLGGLKLNHIPFKGSSEITTALITGEVKMQVSVTTDSLNPYIKAGKIRVLAVATKDRTSLAPTLPTLGEFISGYAVDGWFGILAPANTPLAKRESIARSIQVALADPITRAHFLQLYMEPTYLGPQAFGEVIAASQQNFRQIVRLLGLIPQ